MTTELEMIRILLRDGDVSDPERSAFTDMGLALELSPSRKLTVKQRAWLNDLMAKNDLDANIVENLFSQGKVAIGNPVITPDVLRRLPLKPPGKR